jgi:hypothetical protein
MDLWGTVQIQSTAKTSKELSTFLSLSLSLAGRLTKGMLVLSIHIMGVMGRVSSLLFELVFSTVFIPSR